MNAETLTQALLASAHKLPLEWFVLAASFVEEIVSPIPTYAVMITAGSVARVQQDHILWLLLLACLGAVGKTAACLLYYVLARVFEHALVPRFGRYLGVNQQDIEAVGKRLGESPQRHWLLLAMRALPVIPSVPISIVAGLINLELKLFVWTTWLGTAVKNAAYLFIGYFGARTFERMLSESNFLTHFFELGIAVTAGLFLGWLLWSKRVRG